MKKLILFLGLITGYCVGFFQVWAFLDYSPNCIPGNATICADEQAWSSENSSPIPGNSDHETSPSFPVPQQPPVPQPSPVPQPAQKPVLEGPAGVHIYYQSIEGHDIYAQTTYQGKGGEVVDLARFKKDLATFTFDHYQPQEWSITLQAGKNLRAILVYRKVFRPIAEQKLQFQPQFQTQKQTVVTTWPQEASTHDIKSEKAASIVNTHSREITMISGLFDEYFAKNPQLGKAEKQAFLSALKNSFKASENTLNPQDTTNQVMYRVILYVLDNYSV